MTPPIRRSPLLRGAGLGVVGAALATGSAEAINFAGDRHAADAYFRRTHPFAPLHDRGE
ncbi:hypothetical protein [Saccharothrix deserti]|uniref:hypothetical protein n=1 Tax=Saccharothrix deserti TaxID=2593674 RepID=UPI00131A7922|nr:hypothetical protein [Saccharothrix deserti]